MYQNKQYNFQFCLFTERSRCFCSGSPSSPPASGEKDLLHVALVGLDHFLDHLAADGAGLAAGQVAVVTVLQVDAHLLRCVFTSKISSEFAKLVLKNRQFYTIREQITE